MQSITPKAWVVQSTSSKLIAGVWSSKTDWWCVRCVQVLRHKHFERDGVTSLVLACGAKKAKQLHPRQLGEFQVLLPVSSGCVVQG